MVLVLQLNIYSIYPRDRSAGLQSFRSVPSSNGEDISDPGAQSVVHPTGLRVNGDSCIRAIVRWVEESLRPRLFARVVCQLTCHALSSDIVEEGIIIVAMVDLFAIASSPRGLAE